MGRVIERVKSFFLLSNLKSKVKNLVLLIVYRALFLQKMNSCVFFFLKSLWIFPQIFRRFPVAPLIPYPLITKVCLHCRL